MEKNTEFLKVPEIADQLRISRPKGYELVNKGLIPVYRIDGVIRVKKSDFVAFLRKSRRG